MKMQLEEVNAVIESAMIQLHYCISTLFQISKYQKGKKLAEPHLKKYFFADNMGE